MNGTFAGNVRFYTRYGPYRLVEVATPAGGIAAGADHMLTGITPLQSAGAVMLVSSQMHDTRRHPTTPMQAR